MCTEVSIPVSDRYNALYGEEDLHHSLTLLSVEGRYAESGMRRLAVEASSVRVPSGSGVRDAVSRLSEGDVSTKVERALDSTVRELRRFGRRRRGRSSSRPMPPCSASRRGGGGRR
jgi:hypothetical protein